MSLSFNDISLFQVSQNPLYDYFVNSSHAILLDGVETVATRNVQSTLHSLGGIQVLLPLFQQLSSCSGKFSFSSSYGVSFKH